MARLKPIYRLPVPGAEGGGATPRRGPMDDRTANILDIKNAGTLLVYDVGEHDQVVLQVRKALRDTDLTAMVLTVKHGNFPDGPFHGLDVAVTFAAAEAAKTITTAARYLAIETTTAGSASGVQEVEAGVFGKPRV